MLKVVLFFDSGAVGWTETYYAEGDDPFEFVAPILPPFNIGAILGLLQVRRGMLAGNIKITRIRASVEGQPRNAAVAVPRAANQMGLINLAEPTEDWTTVLVRITSRGGTPAGVFNRNLYLGGIPEANVVGPEGYVPIPPFSTAFLEFRDLLKTAPWKSKVRPAVTRANSGLITEFVVGPTGRTAEIQPDLLPGFLGANSVIIRGLKAPRGWNGSHKAVSANANPPLTGTSTFIGPTRRSNPSLPLFNANQDARIQAIVDYQYLSIAAVIDERLVEHKRGRPFGAPRGRRSVV